MIDSLSQPGFGGPLEYHLGKALDGFGSGREGCFYFSSRETESLSMVS